MDTTLSAPIGQLLDGRYLVESQIARGGMATVYQARDVRLGADVALKIAHPELARDDGFVARFISEARSVARLSSPHVVAVFDQGSTGDLHYIAMEYVPGPTLRELLVARGRLQPREALDIIERAPGQAWRPRTRPASSTAMSSRRMSCSETEPRSRWPTFSAWPGRPQGSAIRAREC